MHIPPHKLKVALVGAPAQTGQIQMVPVDDIHVLQNFNLRVEGTEDFDAGISELAASITANGFYEDKPLAGYNTPDGVIVIDGHRRLAAVNQINGLDEPTITHLPVVLKSENASLADLHIAMIQSASGKELTMFEKGVGVRRLMADGMSKEDISARLGVTVKSLDNWIAVASAPAKARDLLLDGKVTSTTLLRALGKGKDAVAKLTSMVETAKSKGRERARPSDAPAPEPTTAPAVPLEAASPPAGGLGLVTDDNGEIVTPLHATNTTTFSVDILKDGEVGAVFRMIAEKVRAVVPHDTGDADTAYVGGKVTVTVTLDATEKPKRAKKAKQPVETQAVTEPDPLAHAVDPDSVDL